MKKRLLFALLAAMWFSAGPAWGQGFVTGSLTTASASSTACPTSACRSLLLTGQTGTVSVALSGTWTGTVRFEATANGTTWDYVPGDPMATGTAVSTVTANGTWLFNVAALQRFQVRQSIDGTGTIVVKITSSTAFVKQLGPGSLSVGGAITSATEGSVLFAGPGGALAQDNDNLFFNDSTNFLRVGDTDGGGILMGDNATFSAMGYGASDTVALQVGIFGDSIPRVSLVSGGKIEFGPGGAVGSRDTNLYRSAANVLKTDDDFSVVGNISAANLPSITGLTSSIDFSADNLYTIGENNQPSSILSYLFKSAAADTSDNATGLALANAEQVCWEASAAGTDVCAAADSSEIIQITGGTLDGGDLTANTVTPTQIDETQDYTYTTISGKQDRNNSAVSDDDCTGEQGLWWYDTTDSAFEYCNANSGTPAVLGGGSVGTIWNQLLNDTVLASTTEYSWTGLGTWGALTAHETIIAADCTIRNLRVKTTGAAQGVNGSLTIAVYLDTVATAVTLTIAAGTAAGEFDSGVLTAAATGGQEIVIGAVNAHDGASSNVRSWSVQCN